ncbi:transporter substrate-binding domain-containing protein [Sneathiella sp. P13V-1]|uniref:substrate-binding periplasmic protein n=1 Tax=Sneathiella sp. P13V-1 TaxID=2697366 RepID=UPI00187B1D85|nr:transporter substrate-binding domain-containing protein [Sneathiella sp. P13V-1]MBE7635877.1 transporter substrate-binding domain-containing protein [Sneathiella sp. P13V-1]
MYFVLFKNVLLILFAFVFLGARTVIAESNKEKIALVYANKWAPISAGDEEQVKGILPDLMHEILHIRMGLDISHLGRPWGRAQQDVESGIADGFITTPTSARKIYSNQSEQDVLYIPFQAFVRANSEAEVSLKEGKALDKLQNTTFCDVLGNNWAVEFYGARNIDYLTVPSIDICLKMLDKERADVIIHASPVTQLFIKKLKLTDRISMIPHVYKESPRFPLLISKKSNLDPEFLDHFDSTVSEMKDTGEYDRLLNNLIKRNLDLF